MLTTEQKATNFETTKHIQLVQRLLHRIAVELLSRAEKHDESKLSTPEVEMFTEHTPKLAKTSYGSEEYKAAIAAMGPALDHHYARNRHHPEHFKDGINDMNLIDLLEMYCDWWAASIRQNDGNLRKSIRGNAARFNMTEQVVKIMENTVDLVEG